METTPRQNVPAQDCSKQAILRSALSDTSLVLYPRDPNLGQILSGRSNNFLSNVLGLKIGGRLTNRPCMDSLAGDAAVRFRAPGSILITRDYLSPPLSSLQGLLNRGVWTETPVTWHSETVSQCISGSAPSDTSFILYSPRGNLERICTDLPRIDAPGSTARAAQHASGSLVQWQWQNPRRRRVGVQSRAAAKIISAETPPQCSTAPDLATWVQNRPPRIDRVETK